MIVFARSCYPQIDIDAHLAKGYAPLFWLGEKEGFVGKFSSTAIRRELLYNRGVKPAGLAPAVYDYILENDLYSE